MDFMRSNKALSGAPRSTRTSEIRIVKLLFLLFLAALLVAAPSCRMLVREVFKSPKVRVTSVKLSSNPLLSKDPPEIVLYLAVMNPNSYALIVPRYNYSVIVGKQQLASGETNEQFRLEPSQETMVALPVVLNPSAFSIALQEFIETRTVPYEFTGSLDVEAPLVGVMKAPFHRTGEIDPLEFLRKKAIPLN